MMRGVALALALLAGPALAVLPDPPGDPEVAEGARLVEGGRYELGLPLLEAALARLPGDPDILVYIAFAHRRLGRLLGGDLRGPPCRRLEVRRALTALEVGLGAVGDGSL